MKKFFIALCAFAILLPTALGLVACDSNPGGGGSHTTSTQKAREIYALSALVGVNYLDSASSVTPTSVASASESATSRPNGVDIDVVNQIKAGLQVFDELLEKGSITTTIDNHGDADYTSYQFKMTVTLPVSNQEVKIYFNEYKKKDSADEYEDIALTDPNAEIEFSTKLAGLVVYAGEEYMVEGKREFEKDKGETESKIEFKVYEDESNYVEISQKTETGSAETETKYECRIVSEGFELFEFEIEFENENGQLELEIEIEQINGSDVATEREYKIKPGTSNNTFVVSYEYNGDKITINVAKISGGYKFTYSNGYTEDVSA